MEKADNISSDVVCSDPKHAKRFSLSIECKSYHDIKFEHLLLGMKSCKIDSFGIKLTEMQKGLRKYLY